eukprot:TRINITY_DN359_c0_g2_i1.p1 TRINITY_DN359_c0_g2~~TRINITY_DN359_c0_g2_i1.p1  ORF type:complete len:166 (-),score=44.13 TRINITY_DN359_c0_g2_i1:483-980(-)
MKFLVFVYSTCLYIVPLAFLINSLTTFNSQEPWQTDEILLKKILNINSQITLTEWLATSPHTLEFKEILFFVYQIIGFSVGLASLLQLAILMFAHNNKPLIRTAIYIWVIFALTWICKFSEIKTISEFFNLSKVAQFAIYPSFIAFASFELNYFLDNKISNKKQN